MKYIEHKGFKIEVYPLTCYRIRINGQLRYMHTTAFTEAAATALAKQWVDHTLAGQIVTADQFGHRKWIKREQKEVAK